MKMPFGKYKGLELQECPIEYCSWLSNQEWVNDKLKMELDKTVDELRRIPLNLDVGYEAGYGNIGYMYEDYH